MVLFYQLRKNQEVTELDLQNQEAPNLIIENSQYLHEDNELENQLHIGDVIEEGENENLDFEPDEETQNCLSIILSFIESCIRYNIMLFIYCCNFAMPINN